MNAIKGKNITVNIDAVLLAARWVVSNCLKKESPFIFVAHGGGEPTFHWELLTKLTKKVRQVADDAGIGFFSYIATNGNLEQDKVTWLVQNFNLIGLSCDGPVEQNQFQRNGSLNRILKKTARTILEEGGKFDVRSTISRTQIFKQTTIVEYLVDELQAKRIRLEPEYLNQNDPFTVDDARPFIDNFIKASEMAESKGSKVEYSGVRINEIHSSFCDINRNTLRINPQNQFINCFCDVDNQRYPFGTVNFSTNQIELTNFEDLKKKPFDLRPECGNCINVYHCSRGCPDHCVHRDERLNGFKCKLNAELAVELIKKQASWMYGD
jgi:radical SAM protein with 4Fe4S-binding SPASM domain